MSCQMTVPPIVRVFAISTCLILVMAALAASALATPVPVSVTVTSVECTQEDECRNAGIEAAGESWPDFYAKIFINGVETITTRAPDDNSPVSPFGWTAGATIEDSVTPNVPIAIQIWDHDTTSGDDLADSSPQGYHNNTDLVLNLAAGAWSADTTGRCVTGDGVDTDDTEYYPVKVCFDISTRSTTGDLDGDGLLDGWETAGFDADNDGTIDIDLSSMGAKVDHQDVFLELDYEATRPPTRNGIAAMKAAFAAAPRPNPDSTSGIELHVDVGNLVDPTADEARLAGTCTNGLDDDGDGLVDGADTSCTYFDPAARSASATAPRRAVAPRWMMTATVWRTAPTPTAELATISVVGRRCHHRAPAASTRPSTRPGRRTSTRAASGCSTTRFRAQPTAPPARAVRAK